MHHLFSWPGEKTGVHFTHSALGESMTCVEGYNTHWKVFSFQPLFEVHISNKTPHQECYHNNFNFLLCARIELLPFTESSQVALLSICIRPKSLSFSTNSFPSSPSLYDEYTNFHYILLRKIPRNTVSCDWIIRHRNINTTKITL